MNPFIEILQKAIQSRWCTQPFCTTCAAREFRDALAELGRNDDGLAKALSNLSINELKTLTGWEGAIRLALDEIRRAESMDLILRAWLPQLKENILLADIVLFYYVRRGAVFAPMSIDMLKVWIDSCVNLAILSRNDSLLESLVYTLGSRINDHKALNSVIKESAANSRKIHLAIQRNCGSAYDSQERTE